MTMEGAVLSFYKADEEGGLLQDQRSSGSAEAIPTDASAAVADLAAVRGGGRGV